MENEQMQTNKLSQEDLRAALGFSNNILSQTIPPDMEEMPMEAPEAPQTPETAPQTMEAPEVEETPDVAETPEQDPRVDELEGKLKEVESKMDKFRTEVGDTIRKEMSSIRDEIRKSLNE